MAKRSRGQMAMDKLRSNHEQVGSFVTQSPEGKRKAEVLSPVKKLMEMPVTNKTGATQTRYLSSDRFADVVSRLISTFKTTNNVVTSLQARRKQCSWDIVVESYQTISNHALELDDLLTIVTVWKESFVFRWQVKSVDAQNNPRSYELMVEIPSKQTVGNDSLLSLPHASSPQDSASQQHSLRIGTFTDKLYALVNKALREDSEELDIHSDPSLLPPQPEVSLPEHRLRTDKTSRDFLEWEKEALKIGNPGSSSTGTEQNTNDKNGHNNDSLVLTLDVLRARAVERGKIADLKAVELKAQLHDEETTKLLHTLPGICDSLRSLSRRKNRTRMVKKECVESVAASMHIKKADVLSCLEQIVSLVPEFITMDPAEPGVPATLQINPSIPYKELRGFIVDHVKEQTSL